MKNKCLLPPNQICICCILIKDGLFFRDFSLHCIHIPFKWGKMIFTLLFLLEPVGCFLLMLALEVGRQVSKPVVTYLMRIRYLQHLFSPHFSFSEAAMCLANWWWQD